MSPSYEVVIIHKELDDFATEVATAIRTAATDVLMQPDLLDFKYDLPSVAPDSHVAVVYLGSTEGCQDTTVTAALATAVGLSFPVLPIVRSHEPGTAHTKLPEVIATINAADWDVDVESIAAPLTLLAMLGLVEQERKVFLSYKRSDSTPMAVQLHTALAWIIQCAVTRCHSSAGANPARQLSLQPVAVGADDGGNDIG